VFFCSFNIDVAIVINVFFDFVWDIDWRMLIIEVFIPLRFFEFWDVRLLFFFLRWWLFTFCNLYRRSVEFFLLFGF